jgi:uncharacterized membrane-anchored protein YitT (DUF2179 family)
MKQATRFHIRNWLMIVLGSAIFALGFDVFLEPCGINGGGVSGIAMLVVYVTNSKFLTVGLLSAMINIPLFFFGYKNIGKYFFFGSFAGMATSSLCFDLFAKIIPIPTVEPLMAAIFGGAMIGVGLGAVFLAGASTGGVDIVARLLKLKFRNFPIGKIILVMDVITATATGIVYADFNNMLYSVVTLVVSSVVIDKVVYGSEFAKVAMIISEKYEQIALAIDTQIGRGVTLLNAKGFYKRAEKYALLTAVKRQQLAQLKDAVISIDPDAFIILQDAHQVLGDGFKRYDRNEL